MASDVGPSLVGTPLLGSAGLVAAAAHTSAASTSLAASTAGSTSSAATQTAPVDDCSALLPTAASASRCATPKLTTSTDQCFSQTVNIVDNTSTCSHSPPHTNFRHCHSKSINSTNEFVDITSTYLTPNRMTANSSSISSRKVAGEDEAKVAKRVKSSRSSNAMRREPSPDNIMHLRNRALKAATAEIESLNSEAATMSQLTSAALGIEDQMAAVAGGSSRRHSSRRSRPEYSSAPQASITSAVAERSSIRNFFPLRTIGSVCELFRSQICPQSSCSLGTDLSGPDSRIEPDLALLSIVIGIIETSLTRKWMEDSTKLAFDYEDSFCSLPSSAASSTNRTNAGSYSPAEATPAPNMGMSHLSNSPLDTPIPVVYYETVESLLDKFKQQIKDSIDLSKYPTGKKTSRELIKKISEVIWSNLHRSHYKERAHLQTIYTYVTENRLDPYGVSYAVVAACQILGLDDVWLVMSEDHSWVAFGDEETCEVTWHGKGNDDRCGQPIPQDTNCWLYLNGNNVICDRYMTVATLVSSMNLVVNTTQDSKELAILKQQLLWIMYDYGHLKRYPMALGNLGELEYRCGSVFPRKTAIDLFFESIESAKKYYNNCHIYPYSYIADYYFSASRFKDSLKIWAEAAQVIKKYNYTREDEEIYKYFQSIAKDIIPDIVKYSNHSYGSSGLPVAEDAECFAYLLQFYDGLCGWEEDSPTPVLHIGWSKPMFATISKFSYAVRSQVAFRVNNSHDGEMEHEDVESDDSSFVRERRRRRATSFGSTGSPLSSEENGLENVVSPEDRRETNTPEDKMFSKEEDGIEMNEDGIISVVLNSKKFSGLRNLLKADKLNQSAIQLQLTAQSQVNVNKRHRSGALKSVSTAEMDFVSTTTTPSMCTNSNKRFRRDNN